MTHQRAETPATEAPPHRDPSGSLDADQVILRVLAGLQERASHHVPRPRSVPSTDVLPNRVPGRNLRRRDPSADQPPPQPVRDASRIAVHTTNYFSGWRRGCEVADETRAGRLQPAGATITAAPVAAPREEVIRRRRTGRLRPAALRLVAIVVWILPELERPRYAEEFRAELSALHGPHQLAHVLRLLVCAPALRRSLRGAAPGAASRMK